MTHHPTYDELFAAGLLPTRQLDARVLGKDAHGRPVAVCRDLDPEQGQHPDDWFPVEEQSTNASTQQMLTALARRLCAYCPVAAECLELALREEEHQSGGTHGIRGGLTAVERVRVQRGRRRQQLLTGRAASTARTVAALFEASNRSAEVPAA